MLCHHPREAAIRDLGVASAKLVDIRRLFLKGAKAVAHMVGIDAGDDRQISRCSRADKRCNR
jgi:hypothetical protein